VDRILTPRLRQSDIVLTNGAGTNSLPIAEHVLALIFAFARQLPELARSQAKHQWQRPSPKKFFTVQGQTLAVLGLGAIGQTLAAKAHLLGLRVLGVRRNPDGKTFAGVDRIYGIEALDEALAQAHHVAICLPLTEATRGLFDGERFARFRDGAFLYNIGRGPIVDHAALERALVSGKLGGAGLDVTAPEPLPPDSPLWAHPNVIITNHSSAGSQGNAERSFHLFSDNIRRALQDEPLRNVVGKDRGY
jgi:phosphoglycerate dehydrogenase-like enzyme